MSARTMVFLRARAICATALLFGGIALSAVTASCASNGSPTPRNEASDDSDDASSTANGEGGFASTTSVAATGGLGGASGSSTVAQTSASSATSSSSTGGMQPSDIQIIVEPGDSGAALLAAIQGAQSSLHMTMYLLSSTDIINALVAQKKAGREVKVVLNETFPDPGSSNQTAYTALVKGGVSVVWAANTFTYTHEKCVIIDNAAAWIMTMNATYSSPLDNREFLAVDKNAADIAEAEAVFEADYAHTPAPIAGNLLVAPVNARPAIVSLIGSATSSVLLESEELSDYQVVDALTAAKKKGVKVDVVLPSGAMVAAETMAVTSLKQAGVAVVATTKPIIHAKAIVVDGALAFVGSENFTTGSLEYNRELGLIFEDAAEIAKMVTAMQSDFVAGSPL